MTYSASCKRESFYDVLKLKTSCSNKEIKDSYIKLSKKLHPDRNNNTPESNQKFARLTEAYQILSNSESRKKYDNCIRDENWSCHHDSAYIYRPTAKGPKRKNHPFTSQSSPASARPKSYILHIVLFAVGGAVLQFWAIRCSFLKEKALCDERSRKLSEELNRSVQRFKGMSKEEVAKYMEDEHTFREERRQKRKQ